MKDYDGKTCNAYQHGETIEANTVIWAAGIKGNVPAGIDTSLIVKGNRIKVDRYNKVLGHRIIFMPSVMLLIWKHRSIRTGIRNWQMLPSTREKCLQII